MPEVSVLTLGAGCEVGRSCIIVQIGNKKIMLDCGLMIGKPGREALPLFHCVEASELSMILISHAHIDHCGALPYYLANTPYSKKVYMTKATKAIYEYLLYDLLKVREEKQCFSKDDINASLPKIKMVDFGIPFKQDGITVTPYCAGHIVGACMFLIEYEGIRVLYTGDYSCEEDRYIMKAEIPDVYIDVLIVESTYGIRRHDSRRDREEKFKRQVKKIVTRKGKCLLPVFSAGRAEELLHILEEYWHQNSTELKDIKIFYTIMLIENLRKVYEQYINILSKKVKESFRATGKNPFEFRYIKYIEGERLKYYEGKDNGLVVMCTPGMLQSGESRTLLERWCHDPRNGCILTGYCVEGSVSSRLIKKEPIQKLNSKDKQCLQVKMDVEEISFSAHADSKETKDFVRQVDPTCIVLVHGSSKNAEDLKGDLIKTFPHIKDIVAPQNGVTHKFVIDKKKMFQVAGQLKTKFQEHSKRIEEEKSHIKMEVEGEGPQLGAESIEKEKEKENPVQQIRTLQKFKGVLVSNGDQLVLVDQSQKQLFFPELKSLRIRQILKVKYGGCMTLLKLFVQNVFGALKTRVQNGREIIVLKESIDVFLDKIEDGQIAVFEFISSPKNDIITDEFAFLLSHIPDNPEWNPFGALRQENHELKVKSLKEIIITEYPQSEFFQDHIEIKYNSKVLGTIDFKNFQVFSEDYYLKVRFDSVIDNLNQSYQI